MKRAEAERLEAELRAKFPAFGVYAWAGEGSTGEEWTVHIISTRRFNKAEQHRVLDFADRWGLACDVGGAGLRFHSYIFT